MDSAITNAKIEPGLAPNALRMPNSRVRSRTVISMMLLTPTIPAINVPIPIIQINKVIPFIILFHIKNSFAMFHIPIAFLSVGSNWWRRAIHSRKLSSKASFSSSVVTPFKVNVSDPKPYPLLYSNWATENGM